ncbi:alpha/beta fold hydrolase [Spirosoma fluminis]
MNKICVWLVLLVNLSVSAQSRLSTAQPVKVGFRTIKAYDTTRSFDTTHTDSLRFRPVKIDLFYPAIVQHNQKPLPYGFFFNLYGLRVNFKSSADSCRKEGYELAKYWSYGAGLDSVSYLLEATTNSYELAPQLTGRFPLVLYCPGYNGMSYENIALLEQLAASGYLVASVSSVGKFPGVMTMDSTDIIEQVQDARFARQYLQNVFSTIPEKVAVVGYSWGGLAASIVAMREPDIRAVISLDGSENYIYGTDKADDEHFNLIRQADYFTPSKLYAPYLYISSGREGTEEPEDSVFVMAAGITAPIKQYVRLLATAHEDFSYVPYLATQLKKDRAIALTAYPLIKRLVTNWLGEFIQSKPSFNDSLQRLLVQQSTLLTLSRPERRPLNRLPPFTLSGNLTDTIGKPLSYANIGIVRGSQGTVSRENGSFYWQTQGATQTDTVRFSLVGYQSQDWPVLKLIQMAKTGPLTIKLSHQIRTLSDVIVKANRPIRKILGNSTESKFLNAGFDGGQLGTQIGIRVSARKNPTYIEKVDFHISYNRYDSLTVRLNIYQIEKNTPVNNLMNRPAIIKLGKQTGRITFDLTDQPIEINGDVLVAVELLDGKGGSDRGLYLSAGVLNGSTYYRRSSQGNWRQGKGMGVGMRVAVQY